MPFYVQVDSSRLFQKTLFFPKVIDQLLLNSWTLLINGICLTILLALFFSQLGLVPHHHPLYDFFTDKMVPVAIAMLLLNLDFKEVRNLPRPFVWIFSCGIFATVVGALVAALVGACEMGVDAAKLAAQLGASYIGGGENAAAMKVILAIPDALFVGTFAVDNVLTSLWMIVVICYAGSKFGADEATQTSNTVQSKSPNILEIMVLLFLALGIVQTAGFLAHTVGILHRYLYITALAIGVGQLPVLKQHTTFAYPLGVILFIPFFFAMGAASDFAALARLPRAALYMPILVVGIHGAIIFSFGRILRIPRHYVAVASQALIGGPSTAVAVAQAKNWRSGVSIAVLAGVLGYAIANFFGVAIYHISRTAITLWGLHGTTPAIP